MRTWCLIAILSLSACGSLPTSHTPDNPVSPVPENWQPLAVTEIENTGKTDLLGLLSNPEIERWIEQAMLQNPNIQQIALQLEQSGWRSAQQQGLRRPSIDLVSDTNRRHLTQPTTSTNTSYGLALSTRWEMDIWGRLADTHNAAQLDESALAADYQFAKRSLSANLIKAWLTWINASNRLAVEHERLATLQLNENVIRKRYKAGLGKLTDLDTARTDTEQAAATVSGQQEAVNQGLRQIQKLIGQFEPLTELPQNWPEIALPQIHLPARAMGQRPDLIAAFQRIQAADKRSDIAYKNLLPGFKLNLDTNLSNQSSRDLLNSDPAWLLLGQITQPLFQGGRLKAEVKVSELGAEQAYWQYRERLLAAVLEVEEALSQEFSLARQQQALGKALTHARSSQKQFEYRYRQGLADILDLLRAQQTTFNIQSRLLQVELNRVNNRIDLGLALGLPLRQENS